MKEKPKRHRGAYRRILSLLVFFAISCSPVSPNDSEERSNSLFDVERIIQEADSYLNIRPVPLTDTVCDRSAGTPQDFYSEGDYWWPNPEDPQGPYIRKDGQTNPENFIAHRLAMRNLSRWVACLTAAYKLTGDKKYADHALQHLRTWFIDKNTQMNPHLLFAQAIKGRVTGRGIGIIDSIHLIEVAKSIQVLQELGYLANSDYQQFKSWFTAFVDWLTTHPYGIDEMNHGNNHSTWWAAQVAVFAELVGREDLIEVCQNQFKKLLDEQMDEQGGFPDELARTKPYNYTLFNLEGYATLAHVASDPNTDLWNFQTSKGSLSKAINFILPSIRNKENWSYPEDVQHFDELPIQSALLLFAAHAYGEQDYLDIWKGLDPERKSIEIDRTYPIRQLSLWMEEENLSDNL